MPELLAKDGRPQTLLTRVRRERQEQNYAHHRRDLLFHSAPRKFQRHGIFRIPAVYAITEVSSTELILIVRNWA